MAKTVLGPIGKDCLTGVTRPAVRCFPNGKSPKTAIRYASYRAVVRAAQSQCCEFWLQIDPPRAAYTAHSLDRE